jgi:GYF domain 2
MNWNSYYMQKRAKEERQRIIKDSPLSKVNWDAASKASTSEGKRAAFLSQTPPENWYFIIDGRKEGPITREEIKELISSNQLTQEDLVWKTGMADWSTIRGTDLNSGLSEPPPISGEHVNNSIVWLWTFTPLIPVSSILFQQGVAASHLTSYSLGVWFLINTIMWWLDGQQIKNAGHNREGWRYWVLLLVPAYLFARAAKLKQNNAYAILWVVIWVLSTFAIRF